MTTTAPPAYWDELYAKDGLVYREGLVLFKDLFDRYLPRGGSCLEVGCYPGNFLIYLGRRFGYRVSGVDTTRFLDRLESHIRAQGVEVESIHHGDFMSFDPGRTYDVVCSFGFLEHFTDFRRVIALHERLVAPGGTLVISCPNFRRVQFLLHWLLDRQNLRRHHLPAMDLGAWRKVLETAGMTVLHAGYQGTAAFWVEDAQPSAWRRFLVRQIQRSCSWLEWRLARPNPWISPYMISIAHKAGGETRRWA